jgi:hypothetical protein
MAKARRSKDSEQIVPGPSDSDSGNGTGDDRAEGYSAERVAERAYELYLARGGSDGQDFDDWLAAERELSSGPPREESGRSQGESGPERGERGE